MNPSITNRTGAKVRFFAIYTLSILLLFFLVSSFFLPIKKEGAMAKNTTDKRASTIELLHRRMTPLRNASLTFFTAVSQEAKDEVDRQAAVFQTLIDSVRNDAAKAPDKSEEKELEEVLHLFTDAAGKEQKLVQSYQGKSDDGNIAATVPATNDELEELKAILVQKEERIAALEQQKQPSQSAVTGSGNPEWKEKYTKLKLAADKSSAQLEAMRSSYKEVVEDNRRLITQLQAARAAKN